jgi:hypothetical protein
VVALVATICVAQAADEKKPKPEKGSGQAAGKTGAADLLAFVNVAAAFGDGFVYLKDIGEQIDQARQLMNVDAMVNCALQLLYAEQASGKTSEVVNGAALLVEATDMAKVAKNAKALHRIAAIYGDAMLGAADAEKAKAVEQLAKDAEAASKMGPGLADVLFDNYTHLYIEVYVNGTHQGELSPMGTFRVVDVPDGPSTLFAQCWLSDGRHVTWGPIAVNLNEWSTFRWNLKP